MGKRSRRRLGGAPTAVPESSSDASGSSGGVREASGRAKAGPPPPPWGELPLTEIAVFAGLVMLVVGFVVGGRGGTGVIVCGLVLGSIAGFEQALREHRSGYRSHSMALASVPAGVSVAICALIEVPAFVYPIVAIAVMIAAWLPIRASFSRRQA